MKGSGRVVAACSACLVLGACSSSTGSPSSTASSTSTTVASAPYGNAVADPVAVSRGGRITITPTRPVQVLCLLPATVWTQSSAGLIPAGLLSQDGTWQSRANGDTTVLPSCLPPLTADTQSYDVTHALAPGRYVFCLTMQPEPAACATVQVR